MNLKLLFLCLLLPAGFLFAQKGSVSGKVIDKTSSLPISYVSIVVKDSEKVVTGGLTDDNGNFEIKNLDPKKYTVEIQYMGYKTQTKISDLSAGQTVNFGTIILEDEATKLNDVNIVVERSTIEQKIDRKVITVGRDLTTAGATAAEIMSNIPSVNVDQDGRLSLRGNENVRVLVDGRPTNIEASQLLKQIPSTSIKRIELITNPSAKYNPEGMSGIINIVLHKSAADGFNASINSGLTIGRAPKGNNSINMNFRRNKVNFFGTYGNNYGQYYNDGDIRRIEEGSREVFDIVNDNKSQLFKIGMDFYIDDRNTISAYTNQNYSSGEGIIDLRLLSIDPAQALTQRSIYIGEDHDAAYNLAYKHLFAKEGKTLDIEANHADSQGDQDANFDTDYVAPEPPVEDFIYDDVVSDKRTTSTLNIDFVNPLTEKSTLELGAEARLITADNSYQTTLGNVGNSEYDYDLQIYSAYATFGQKFDKFNYQVGARFESYRVNAELNGENAYEDDYFTLYPSASLVYNPSEKNQYQLSYSRRVDRPSLEQTIPIRQFATPRVTSVGNPELDPQFTNSIEFNYTRMFEKGSITSGIYFRHIDNEISRIIYPDPETPDTRQILSFDNFDDNTAFGFEVSANYKITAWWDIQPAIDFSSINQTGLVAVRQDDGNYEYQRRDVTAAAFNGRINSNFKATKQLRFLLFGFYRSEVEGIQSTSSEMYKIDAGGRYSFMDDKATISVRVNDIFDTQQYSFRADHPIPSRGTFGWESRTVFVGVNWMFGAGKNRELQRKQRDDNTKQSGGGLF